MNVTREQVEQALDVAITLSRQYVPQSIDHRNPNHYADKLMRDLLSDLLMEREDEDR